jgi:succinate dehydrogenase / fumarate reductase iron-sulfur subunit
MKVTLEIQRFDPHTSQPAHLQRFEVEAEPTDRILSLLLDIKAHQDPTLGFRKSCAHGVCGSDAMRLNGKERLACKTLVRDVLPEDGGAIRVEPLRNLPLERDLMVNQEAFFERFEAVKPFFINDAPPPEAERIQPPAERHKIDDASNCILCESCYSACPVIPEENRDFLGPAALLQSIRFEDDSRDDGSAVRRPVLDHPNGLHACQSHFDCTRVCPRGIKITKHINQTKRRLAQLHKENG